MPNEQHLSALETAWARFSIKSVKVKGETRYQLTAEFENRTDAERALGSALALGPFTDSADRLDAVIPTTSTEAIPRLEEPETPDKVDLELQRGPYSTSEIAQLLGRHPITIRKWCSQGVIAASRAHPSANWSVSHAEAVRLVLGGEPPPLT